MKKIVLAIAILIAGSNLYAQDKKAVIEEPQQTVERMDKAVGLSEQQKATMVKVFISFQQRLNAVMNDGKPEDIDRDLDAVLQTHNQQVKQTLTGEQYKKWIAANSKEM